MTDSFDKHNRGVCYFCYVFGGLGSGQLIGCQLFTVGIEYLTPPE